MNDEPQNTQVGSDDQDLAKALAGITNDTSKPTPAESPDASSDNSSESPAPVTSSFTQPATNSMPTPTVAPTPSVPEAPAGSDLDGIKKDALSELRPLVDKLTLEPQEMFDTYLLLIRSTDDKALIAPAHAAAQKITDESKKAQALLEIVKEIDYLTNIDQSNV